MIIRGRGRRSLPLEWSPIPIMDSPQKRQDRTPIKRSPGKGLFVLRSSPRKRLQLNDAELVHSRKVYIYFNFLCIFNAFLNPDKL